MKIKLNIFIITIISSIFLNSCLTLYKIPEEYVPDEEVVFLKQRIDLKPIQYDTVTAEPYDWHSNIDVDINPLNPNFLKVNNFSLFLKPNFLNDVKLYKEISAHLLAMKENETFLELRQMLDQYTFVKPEPRKIVKGNKLKEYSNSIEYEYPESKDATISCFTNGDYKISFPDGRKYFQKRDGRYFEKNANDSELYAVFPKRNQFRINENGIKHTIDDNHREIESGEYTVGVFEEPEPQYKFKTAKSPFEYVFFIDENRDIYNIACIYKESVLRYDYFMNNQNVLIVRDNESISLDKKYEKRHMFFNKETRTTEHLISYYFPEGIRISGFDKQLTYSEVNPRWPENYLYKRIGPFKVLYTEKDTQLISKIDSTKLNTIVIFAKEKTGLSSALNRVIILPPDLKSYRKLHAADREETLYWYPSGFQLKDVIVMWPPSVKRYELREGEEYFWDEEFYDILIHEFTHLMVGEVTGIFSFVPVWLNEGLALYVECEWSESTKLYWDVTFDVAYHKKRLLSWDSVTQNNTSYFSMADARTHYAQSYKMVSYLITAYGRNKVVEYLKSFRQPMKEHDMANLTILYKDNFLRVFNDRWEDNLVKFDEHLKLSETMNNELLVNNSVF